MLGRGNVRRERRAWLGMLLGVTALAAAVVLAACGSDSSDDSGSGDGTTSTTTGTSTTASGGGGLVGKTFDSTSVIGHELVEGTRIRLTFDADRMGANAGCNTMSGAYSLTDGTLKWTDAPAATMMGCEAPLQAQDEWLAALLTSGVDAEQSGDKLTLTTDTVTIELQAETDKSVTGTAWTLESTIANEAVSSLPAGVEAPTLKIAQDGEAAISTGCNTGGTTVEVSDTALVFGPIRLTKMACPSPEATSLEATVLAVLDGSVDLAIDGETLTLTKGDQGLVYRAG